MDNCTSNNFIVKNDYLPIYGIDISNQKDRYFTIGENKRQSFGFFINKRHIIVTNNEEKKPRKGFYIAEQLKEAEFNHELTEKMKEKLIDPFFKYKNAFATDKEPLGAIILNVEKPYSPLTTTSNDPPPWVLQQFSLGPSWGQLATPYLLWPIGPLWCSMALWPYHIPLAFYGLRPYPAIIGLPGQFPYLQPPGLYLCSWVP
ncbi:hypothetical protein O181_059965 [Austropuccinia psidii MF-1]|uniref:Uncharacterized protein n=1 Tax=Austropuccinia psidii MF-1 TaxID=1389203 RepID=A0A9Q3EJH2_9BASI|nr:hypothetical protein [Austropuccinia psidii MF-1]